jgi:hypothetical protein
MAIVINGSGTVTGLAVGGLPDGTVDAGTLATNSVDSAELIDGAVDDSHIGALAASKLTGNLPAINGSALTNLPSATPSAGDVVQVIYFESTGGTNDNSTIPFTDTHLAATITPQYSNSKIIAEANCQMYMNNTSGECSMALDFKRAIAGGATTSNISGDASNSTAQHRSIGNGELTAIVPYRHIDTPNTTSAITYTLQYAGAGSANTIVGWQDKADSLMLMEIKV